MNRDAVRAIEIHVVSNRDRVAHQLFDLWFEQLSLLFFSFVCEIWH